MCFSPDGAHIASVSSDKTVKIWNVNKKTCIKTLLGHTDDVCRVVYNKSGSLLASGAQDSTIKLWSTDTFETLKTLLGPQKVVTALVFTDDN